MRIKAFLAQLNHAGNSGFKVQVWCLNGTGNKAPFSKFIVDLHGKLFKVPDEVNPEYCIKHNLGEVILAEAHEYRRYKFSVVKGEKDREVDRVRYDNSYKLLCPGQRLSFNDKTYTVIDCFNDSRNKILVFNIEQVKLRAQRPA